MRVYRISKTRYAKDLSGEGAKIVGGRWNHPGIPSIYAGDSKSICLLEFSAHTSLHLIPRALSFTTFEVPDKLVKEIKIDFLPGNWYQWPHTKEARDFGSGLLNKNKDLILRFPSAIIQDEFIYVINPLHAKMKEVKIIEVNDYAYDVRIKSQ